MSFIVDLKQFVEADTSTNVYPMHIPQDASLPAIEMSQISYNTTKRYKKNLPNFMKTNKKKGNIHNGHQHPKHIFSAVYYAKAEKSSLIFQIERSKIQEGFLFQYNVKNYNYFNSSSWTLEVNSGDVLIFPGHLQHSSSICETDERIVVGSSFFIKEKIGLEGDYNDIYLKGE